MIWHEEKDVDKKKALVQRLRTARPTQKDTFLTLAECLRKEPSPQIRLLLVRVFSENAAALVESTKSDLDTREYIAYVLETISLGPKSPVPLERLRHNALVSSEAAFAAHAVGNPFPAADETADTIDLREWMETCRSAKAAGQSTRPQLRLYQSGS